jgi:hypothetical protein
MTDAAPEQSERIFRLIYRSRNRIPAATRRAVLGELFTAARGYNKRTGITGALLLSDDWFVQTLEGEEPVVRDLYRRILEARAVDRRVFARWAMARVTADGTSDVPLIAHTDGIAPAARRGDTTPEQSYLLMVMRDATRVDPVAAPG